MPASPEIREAIRQGSWIRKMFEEGARLKSAMGQENVFDFSLGNPYGAPPEELLEEIRKLASAPPGDLHRYMPNAGFPEVRKEVAASLERSTGLPFRGEHVIMTTGAAGALNVALRAILSPGDEVLVIAPYFAEYLFYIRNVGGVPVVAESAEDFQLDIGAIRAALSDRTKAVIINTPNNPTGAVYPREPFSRSTNARRTGEEDGEPDLRPVRRAVPEDRVSGILLLSPRGGPSEHPRRLLPLEGPERPRGEDRVPRREPARGGRGEIPEACVFCNRVLGFVNAPSLMQRAVSVVQDLEPEFPVYRTNRDALVGTLAEAGFAVVPPGGAFYLFPRSPGDDEMAFVAAARKENILVVPGSGFGRAGHFRIAFCVSPDTVTRSLPAWRRLGARAFRDGGKGGTR